MKRFMLAALLMIIPSALLGGCGTLNLGGGGRVRDGMSVVNSTRYNLVVYRNGEEWTGVLPPGGDVKIPTTNWSGNNTNNGIAIYAKAYEGTRFVGTADHGMIYPASYETYRVPWIIHDGDIRK